MRGDRVIVGVFGYLDDALRAVKQAQEGGYDYTVYSPFASHDIEHAAYPEKSPVRRLTLTGAVTGCIFGFSLAILCSMDWPMRVSAKDVISVPGFVVIGYECTILFGALATLLGLLHFCRVPDLFRKPGYDGRFSIDKFGVVVGCDTQQVDAVKAKLQAAGAEEVEVRDAL